MTWHKQMLTIAPHGKGLYPITDLLMERLHAWHVQDGMMLVFIPHTSASLLINESYDPTAGEDIESFFEKLAPEMQAWYRHTLEGADDSSSHLRTSLLPTSLTLIVEAGSLLLGTWQGVYLFEHRSGSHQRNVLIRCLPIQS